MRYFLLFFITGFTFAQQTHYVDFKSVVASVSPSVLTKTVEGYVNYKFQVLKTIDTIKIDAISMEFSSVKINNKEVAFKNSGKQLQLFEGFKNGDNQLTFEYKAKPKQTLYFTGQDENLQIWTQGQGKYTSHWFPSFDDVNEKLVFSLNIIFDKNYEVISNGILNHKERTKGDQLSFNGNGVDKYWNYSMAKPMSSYLLMLAIGKFDKTIQKSNSGVALEMYYRPEDAIRFETTYRHSKAIFDFFEKEIGVPYPWEIYKQVPVRDFLYGGMENTSATVFSQDYVVDSIAFNDRNYINVNAHELAHQWFGDLITAKSGKDHWLQEGFATYYALLAEKHLFGDDHFNWKLYEMAERLQQESKTDLIPILNEKASSLTFYQKGAWALHVLHEAVGKKNFDKAVKNYLKKYAFQNVTTDDFLAEINKVSDFDTTTFRKIWLEQSGFEVNEAIILLKKNRFMSDYFEMLSLQEMPFLQKKETLGKVLKSDAYYPIKQEVVFQMKAAPFEEKKELLELALQTKDIHVRQAVASSMDTIPLLFYKSYHGLLDDNSYITKEIVLNTLWSQFPEQQTELLQKTRAYIGFNDKNLRVLWLSLALITKDFEPQEKVKYYQELLDYTSPKYESQLRQNALTNLLFIDPNDTNPLQALVGALTHHKWQFTKFGRDRIRALLKKEKYRTFYTELLPKLPEDQQVQLAKLLKE